MQASEYKTYPTGKNLPASLKGGADQRVKSNGEIAGYSGDVLKADQSIREGKGMQFYLNGTVMEGYFAGN